MEARVSTATLPKNDNSIAQQSPILIVWEHPVIYSQDFLRSRRTKDPTEGALSMNSRYSSVALLVERFLS